MEICITHSKYNGQTIKINEDSIGKLRNARDGTANG